MWAFESIWGIIKRLWIKRDVFEIGLDMSNTSQQWHQWGKLFLCRLVTPQRKRGRSKRTWKEVMRIDQQCILFKDLDRIDWNDKALPMWLTPTWLGQGLDDGGGCGGGDEKIFMYTYIHILYNEMERFGMEFHPHLIILGLCDWPIKHQPISSHIFKSPTTTVKRS